MIKAARTTGRPGSVAHTRSLSLGFFSPYWQLFSFGPVGSVTKSKLQAVNTREEQRVILSNSKRQTSLRTPRSQFAVALFVWDEECNWQRLLKARSTSMVLCPSARAGRGIRL